MAGAADFQELSTLVGDLTQKALQLADPKVRDTLHRNLAIVAMAESKKCFTESRSPEGKPWIPLRHPRVRGGGGQKPLYNHGLLMGSITAAVQDDQLIQSSNLEYASLHQFGGTITPKKGKYLAIPLTRQAVTAGRPRNFPTVLVFLKGPRGAALVERGLKGKPNIGHYALVTSVTVPARPFLGFSIDFMHVVDDLLLSLAEQLEPKQKPKSPWWKFW